MHNTFKNEYIRLKKWVWCSSEQIFLAAALTHTHTAEKAGVSRSWGVDPCTDVQAAADFADFNALSAVWECQNPGKQDGRRAMKN